MTTRTSTMFVAITTLVACKSDRPDPLVTPPTLDLVTIEAGPAAVHTVGCPPDGPLANDGVVRRVSLSAFAIAREPVTCEELTKCRRAGVCGSIALTCTTGFAFERHEDAEKYCRWVGGRLPSYAEWQRAIRGAEGSTYLGGSSRIEGACEKAPLVPKVDRCRHRSGAGLTYHTQSSRGEWTSDVGCDLMARPASDGSWEKYVYRGPVAVNLEEETLSKASVVEEDGNLPSAAEFRCAVDL